MYDQNTERSFHKKDKKNKITHGPQSDLLTLRLSTFATIKKCNVDLASLEMRKNSYKKKKNQNFIVIIKKKH